MIIIGLDGEPKVSLRRKFPQNSPKKILPTQKVFLPLKNSLRPKMFPPTPKKFLLNPKTVSPQAKKVGEHPTLLLRH